MASNSLQPGESENLSDKVMSIAEVRPHFLYLLSERDKPDIKIGVSVNLWQRWDSLRASVDVDNTVIVTGERHAIFKLEKLLHFVLAKHQVYKPVSDGSTEWFDSAVLDHAKDVLALILRRRSDLSYANIPSRPTQAIRLDDDEIHLRRQEARTKSVEKRKSAWIALWQSLMPSLTELNGLLFDARIDRLNLDDAHPQYLIRFSEATSDARRVVDWLRAFNHLFQLHFIEHDHHGIFSPLLHSFSFTNPPARLDVAFELSAPSWLYQRYRGLLCSHVDIEPILEHIDDILQRRSRPFNPARMRSIHRAKHRARQRFEAAWHSEQDTGLSVGGRKI